MQNKPITTMPAQLTSGFIVLPNGHNAAGTFGANNSNEIPMISQGESGEVH